MELARLNALDIEEAKKEQKRVEVFTHFVCHSRKIGKAHYVRDLPDDILHHILSFAPLVH